MLGNILLIALLLSEEEQRTGRGQPVTISNDVVADSIPVRCVNAAGTTFESCAGGGGTEQTDDTTLSIIYTMGALFDTTPPSITNGNVGVPRMDSNRYLFTVFPSAQSVTFTNTTLAVTQSGTWTTNIGSFPDNEPINVAQVNGTAVSVNTGNNDAGSQRVVLANGGNIVRLTDYTGTNIITKSSYPNVTDNGLLTREMSYSILGTIAAFAQQVDLSTGYTISGTSIDISGTWVGTINFYCYYHIDQVFIKAQDVNNLGTFITSTTTNGAFLINSTGCSSVGATALAWTSGTANVRISGTPGGIGPIGTILAAGTNNIGDVDVLTLPSVTIGTFPDNEPVDVTPVSPIASDYLPVRLTDGTAFYTAGGGGGGGTSQVDNTALASITGAGALYDTTPPTITDGNVGIPRMDSSRYLFTVFPSPQTVRITDSIGTTIVSSPFVPNTTDNGLNVRDIGYENSGTITANSQSVTLTTLYALSGGAIDIAGTWTGTIEFFCDHGPNRRVIQARIQGSIQVVTSTTSNGAFILDSTGCGGVGARSTAWTSGTATINVFGTPGGTGLTVASLVAGTNNIGDVDVLTLPALPAGTNNIGDVDVVSVPIITKGTQGTTGLTTQDLKDAGRVQMRFYATGIAAGASGTDTLITLTHSIGTAATTTAASRTITSGKTFRITAISVATRGNATATIQTTTFRFRLNTAGACIVSSTPIMLEARSATPATASAWDRVIVPIPGGWELVGDGTDAFCISAVATYVTNAPTWDVIIHGYEY